MVLNHEKYAVGLLPTREDTESALKELKDSGFSMENIGVLATDLSREAQRGNAERERTAQVVDHHQEGAVTGVVTGTAKGGIGGLLVGIGTLAIAGVGATVEGGTGKTALANILPDKGIAGFADTWMGALAGRGIPEQRASIYSDRVSRGDYLVMVEGTQEEIATAERSLSKRGIQEWVIYDAPTAEAVNV
jgi:hypothetical protein